MTTAPVPTEKKIRDIEWMDKIRLNPDLVAKEAHGVETHSPVMFLNTGDFYVETILFNMERNSFHVASPADFLEG